MACTYSMVLYVTIMVGWPVFLSMPLSHDHCGICSSSTFRGGVLSWSVDDTVNKNGTDFNFSHNIDHEKIIFRRNTIEDFKLFQIGNIIFEQIASWTESVVSHPILGTMDADTPVSNI